MHFEGSEEIHAPRSQVWDFVTDPRRIAYCVPGVEQLEIVDDQHFAVVARIGIGVISARFRANVEMSAPTLGEEAEVRVRAAAPGSAVDGTGRITLIEGPLGTVMDWRADVALAGRLAGLGSRLIEGAAAKMTQDVFARIKAGIETSA